MSHALEKKEAEVKTENQKVIGSIKIDSFYKAIVETIREPLLILDSDLRILHANKSFYKVFKVDKKETIGNLIYDLGNRQWDIPKLHTLLDDILMKNHQFVNFQIESNFPVVGERIMQLNARRVIHQNKNQQLILLAIEDVTERILIEKSLLISEEKFRRAFETARDAVLLIDKISGKIVNSNQSAQNLLNYSSDELLELKLWEIGFLRDEIQFSDTNLALEEKGLLNFNNVSVKTKDKTEITADVYLMDKAKVIQCNIRDITERKLLDDKLFENEERYHELFNHISSGVAVYEAVEGGNDFIFKDYNPAAEKIDHKSRSEVIGRKVTDVFPGIREITLLETFQRVWKTGQPEHHPVSFYKDKDLTGWRENFVYKLPSGEIVVVYNDLTEAKKSEEKISWLASFPEINPLMVLEIDKNSHIVYMNQAVKKRLPDIETNSKNHPFFSNISLAIESLQKENIENTVNEVAVGTSWFSQIICSIKNSANFRIYAYDITIRKQAELARQVLFEIVQAAIATEDLTEFFIQLHASISKIVYAENFYVFLYDKKKAIFDIAFSTDTLGSPFQILQMKKCLVTTTFGNQQSSIFTQEQLKKLQKKNVKDLNEKRPLSGLCVPLKISDDTIGVVSLLDYEKEGCFQDSDKELFNLVAGQIAQVILQKQTQNDLFKRNRMLRMLSETNKQLIRVTKEKELLEAVCKIIVEDGDYRMVWIGYAEQDPEKSVTPVAQKGFETGYLDNANITWADTKHGRGPTGTAIRTNTPTIVRNIPDDPNYLPWRDAAIKRGYKSSIAIPLTIIEKPIGALNIYSNSFDAFDEEEISLLTELAGDLTYGIASLRTREAQVLAEAAMYENEEKFKFVFENSVEGKAIISPSGEMHVNKAFYELLGYSEDEMQKKGWRDITHPDDFQITQDEVNSLLSGKKTAIRFSRRYIKKDGSIVWADTLTSLRRDEKQNPMYFIIAVIDISERVTMEQELKDSIEFQQSVFETTSLATTIIDKDMTILNANKEFELLSGFSKEEIKGKKKWTEFVAPEYLEMMMDYHDQRRTDRARTPKQYEFKFITRKGDLKDIFLNIDMIPGTQKSVASLFDITERKRDEKALREANTIINRSPAVAFLWKNKTG
ncbi:MAG: PAS domain S-box protein [Anaerolineaceae bacterium]